MSEVANLKFIVRKDIPVDDLVLLCIEVQLPK